MKIKLIVFILLLLLPVTSIFSEELSEWYPFYIQNEIDSTSPFNFGKIILDPPSGKHGFVKVKNGHLTFEDETSFRFWGTNVTYSSCFPTKEEAVIIANRIAFLGFNMVRFHLIDSRFDPEGIFKDTNPGSKNIQNKKTGILSKTQLDKMDYFIYQLKLRGIYVYLDLLSGRFFTLADGVTKANELLMAAKPVSLFDTTLIRLQKQYSKDLLTHYNPYTQLKYCEDPTIAMVGITNENSLFNTNIRTHFIPEYYASMLNLMYTEWLKTNTAGTINNFYVYLEKIYYDDMVIFLRDQNEIGVKIPISGLGGYNDSKELTALENCDVIDTHTYWDHPNFPRKEWDKYDFTIKNGDILSSEHDSQRTLYINTLKNRNPGNKPYLIGEFNQPYPNQYAYDLPLLLASEGLKNNWDGLLQFNFSGGYSNRYATDNIFNYFEINANPQQLILNSIAGLLFLKTNNIESSVSNNTLKINSSTIFSEVGLIKDKTIILDNFTIIPDKNGAVVLYKNSNRNLLITMSEVKNTNSGWSQDNKFNWGTSPVLLKKIGVDVAINSNNKLNIYCFDKQGIRKEKISSVFNNNIVTFSTKQYSSPWFEIAKSISISPYSTTLTVDKTLKFAVSDGNTPYTWSIDDTTAAYIDSNGLLTPKSNITTRTCKVKVIDKFEDADSSIITIIHINEKPGTPKNSYPPDRSEVNTLNPKLEITNASDLEKDYLTYEFNLYDSLGTSFSISGIPEDSDGTTEWNIPYLLINHNWYSWKCRAIDQNGAPSDWTDKNIFFINTSNFPPTSPEIINPTDKIEITTQLPVLIIKNSIDPEEDKIKYFFEIDTTNTFNSPKLQISGETDETSYQPIRLEDNTFWYWRARSYDGRAYSTSWINGIFFINTQNDPPSQPILLYPKQTTIDTLTPEFHITSTDIDYDNIMYNYRILDTTGNILTTVNDSNSKLQINFSFNNNYKYYWIAKANDEHGLESNWSEKSWFICSIKIDDKKINNDSTITTNNDSTTQATINDSTQTTTTTTTTSTNTTTTVNKERKNKKICLISKYIPLKYQSSGLDNSINKLKDKYLMNSKINKWIVNIYYSLPL